VVRSWTGAATIGLVPNPAVFGYPRHQAARRRALRRKYSALFYVFSDTLTSPPLLPQWPASPAPRDLSSLSWPLQRLAGGHQRLRDEFPHSWYLSVVFPGVFSYPDAKVCSFT
jgi:hypothetical protein